MTTTSDQTGLAFLCLFAFVTLAACGTKDQPQPVALVPDPSAAAVVVKRLVMGRASLALSGLGGSTTESAQIFDQKLIKRVCYS